MSARPSLSLCEQQHAGETCVLDARQVFDGRFELEFIIIFAIFLQWRSWSMSPR
jgi:hypothetical protein